MNFYCPSVVEESSRYNGVAGHINGKVVLRGPMGIIYACFIVKRETMGEREGGKNKRKTEIYLFIAVAPQKVVIKLPTMTFDDERNLQKPNDASTVSPSLHAQRHFELQGGRCLLLPFASVG